jgi:hypothetical protein
LEYEKPFAQEAELSEKIARLNELNVQLDLENGRTEDVGLSRTGKRRTKQGWLRIVLIIPDHPEKREDETKSDCRNIDCCGAGSNVSPLHFKITGSQKATNDRAFEQW